MDYWVLQKINDNVVINSTKDKKSCKRSTLFDDDQLKTIIETDPRKITIEFFQRI